MTYHTTIEQDIDLWEAWIELDYEDKKCFGTLYVMGEILIDKNQPHPFFVKCDEETDSRTLVLRLQGNNTTSLARAEEVMYSECLGNIDKYSSIKIYRDNELLTQIHEIEIVVS